MLKLLLAVGLLIATGLNNPIETPQVDSKNDQLSSCTVDSNYRLMSTKTSYDAVANMSNFDDYEMPGCTQIGVWIFSRHGERTPMKKELTQMIAHLGEIRDRLLAEENHKWLCANDLKELANWKPAFSSDQDAQLTEKGRQLMTEFGARMRKRLEKVINSTDVSKISVQVTSWTRTQDSAVLFLDGLLNNSSSIRPAINFDPKEDYLLRFPDFCWLFKRLTAKNNSYCPESKQFSNHSRAFKQVREVFFQRLGLEVPQNDHDSTFNMVLKACQYGYLTGTKESVWCKFFDRSMFQTLEYQEDIKYHCKYGFRHNISLTMACDLLKHLSSSLDGYRSAWENGETNATAKMHVLFTHSSAVLPLLANLGIGKNESDFNPNDIENENKHRSWRVSKLDPMNSNLVMVLYACKGGNSTRNATNFTLRTFHNENLIKLEACRSKDCSLQELQTLLEGKTDKCVSSKSSCEFNKLANQF